jgi:ABC-type glycerol-3-phosphate transport system permease component
VLLGAVAVLPAIVWVLSTSFKDPASTVTYPPQWIPSPLVFDNYAQVFTGENLRFFLNSIIYAGGTILLTLAVGVPAAYVATRSRSSAMERFMTGILVLSMVPGISVFVSLYSMFVKTPLINSYPLLVVVYTGMISGQAILFLRSFIESVPVELEEAAALDGCSRIQILFKVVLPLIRPGLAAIAIFMFVFVWNDFLVGTILATSDSMRTVQNGLVRYTTTGFGNFWGLFAAFLMVAFAPVLVVFVSFERWFIAGMTSGGVKG